MTDNIFDLAAFAQTKPSQAMVLNIVRMFHKACMNDLQRAGTVMFRTAEGGDVHKASKIDDVAQIVVEVLQHMMTYVLKEFDDLEKVLENLSPYNPNTGTTKQELNEIGAILDTFDMIGETFEHVFGEPITEQPVKKRHISEEEKMAVWKNENGWHDTPQHRSKPDKEEEEDGELWEKWLEEEPEPPGNDDDDSDGPVYMDDDEDEDDPDMVYDYDQPAAPAPPPPPQERKEEEKKD
jgi:hypothetical protein